MHAPVLLLAALLAGGPSRAAAPGEHRLVLDERAGRRLELVRTARAETSPPLEGTLELVEGGARRRLADDIGAAGFTSDGAILVVRRGALLRLDGPRARTLVPSGLAPELRVDPAGARVALVRRRPSGDSALEVLALQGDGPPRQVVSGPGYHNAPAFAPDGRALLFVSTRTGLSSLFRVDLETGEVRQLTNRGLTAVGPGFVPPPELHGEARFEGPRYTWAAAGARWFADLATGASGRADRGGR